jgi:DNA-directed RNA polymerase
MTIPSNATDFILEKYLEYGLVFRGYGILKDDNIVILNPSEEKVNKEINETEYETENENEKDKIRAIFAIDSNSSNFVIINDLRYFIKLLNKIIFHNYHHIKLLIDYLKGIAKIFNTYNLPIIWILPTGLEINPKDITMKSKRIKPYSFSEKTFNITVKTKSINKVKQINALMPNLVHS